MPVSPWTAVVTATTPAAAITLTVNNATHSHLSTSVVTKYLSAWAGPVTATTLTGAAALTVQNASHAHVADGAATGTTSTGFGQGGFGQGGFGGVTNAPHIINLVFTATPVTPPPAPTPTPVVDSLVGRVTVELGFNTDPTVAGGTYLHWGDPVRGLWDAGVWAPDNVWTDVTPWLQSCTWQRGANRIEGPVIRYDEGSATVVLNNDDGRFHPLNTTGPYTSAGVSQVRPMVPVRIRGTYNNTWYDLWRGFVSGSDCIQVAYPAPDRSVATFACVDAQKVLGSKARIALIDPVGEGEFTGARVRRILDSASWPTLDRLVDAGQTTVVGTTLEGDAWSELLLVQDTEIGEMYIDPTGKVVFKDRHAILTEPLSTTSQAIFGRYGQPGELPYVSLVPAYDDEDVRNVVFAARAEGVTQQARDEASITTYLEKTFERSDLLMQTDAEANDWADYVLAASKDAQVRFTSITINPAAQPDDLWPQVFARDFGDRITIRSRPPGVGLVERDVFIRGIAGSYEGLNRLTVTWTLQAATKATGLIWDTGKWGQQTWSY